MQLTQKLITALGIFVSQVSVNLFFRLRVMLFLNQLLDFSLSQGGRRSLQESTICCGFSRTFSNPNLDKEPRCKVTITVLS